MVAEQLVFTWPPAVAEPHPLAPLPEAGASRGPTHCRLIADLVTHEGAWTVQFRKQVQQYLKYWTSYGPGESDEIDIPRFVPDAYRIDVTWDGEIPRARITVWEVEVAHAMPARKLLGYTWFWADLDASDVMADFELRAVDKHGSCRVIDLLAIYQAEIERLVATR